LDTELILKKDKKIYKLLTIGIFTIEFVYAMAGTVWSVILPYLMIHYNKSVTDIGAATSLYGVGSILSVLMLMYLLDRFKKPKVLSFILVVFFIGILLQGLASGFYVMPIAYFIFGSAGMAMDTVNSAIIVDIYGDKSKTYINILQGMFGLGSIMGPLYAQFIISSGLQWNMTYMFSSAAIAVLFVIYTVLIIINKDSISRLHHTSNPEKTGNELTIKQFIGRKEVLVTIGAVFLIMGAQNSSTGWLVKYMKENLQATAEISTLAVTLYFIGVTSTRFTTPILYKKIEPLKLLIILLGIGSATMFAVYMTDNPYLIPIGTFFGGFGIGTATPVIVSNLCSFFPGQSGRASSFAFLGMGFSGVTFSFFTAWVITSFGLKAGVVMASVLMMLSIPFLIKLLKQNREFHKNLQDDYECDCPNFENEIHEPVI